MPTHCLILASTSSYRRELLSRFGLDFEVVAPGVDETVLPGEGPPATAQRLATAKAEAVARLNPRAVVIGSDQVAESGGMRLEKPGNRDNAIQQLSAMSGQSIVFHTAVTVVGPSAIAGHALVPTRVRFRRLALEQIERYVDREKPFDCAGSAKVEGLGISLIEGLEGNDPTALIGLPLIALTDLLALHGIRVP